MEFLSKYIESLTKSSFGFVSFTFVCIAAIYFFFPYYQMKAESLDNKREENFKQEVSYLKQRIVGLEEALKIQENFYQKSIKFEQDKVAFEMNKLVEKENILDEMVKAKKLSLSQLEEKENRLKDWLNYNPSSL